MQLRAFEVRPKESSSQPLSELHIGVGNQRIRLLLPPIKGVVYHLLPHKDGRASVQGEDFVVKKHGFLKALIVRAQARWLVKPKKQLLLKDLVVLARGDRTARDEFKKVLSGFRTNGISLDQPELWQFPELLWGWSTERRTSSLPRASVGTDGPPRVAIVAHIYYPDVWPEIASILRKIDALFDLIITTTQDREALSAEIRAEFPQADIRVFENRGRDVRPFICLLEEGRLDQYAFVCKIHGKKSVDGGRAALLGNIWRNRLLFDLLAGPGVISRTLSLFSADKTVGIVGSRVYRFPNANLEERASWGRNRETVLAVAKRMGVAPEDYRLDFFGGTMFWVRPAALAPLKELKLSEEFSQEQGKLDGALEHALERLFSTAAEVAGYRMASVDGLEGAEALALASDAARLPSSP